MEDVFQGNGRGGVLFVDRVPFEFLPDESFPQEV